MNPPPTQVRDKPGAAQTGHHQFTARQWLALGVMCFTVLLISLDQTVLNVAFPTLVKELHPSTAGLQWIADGYTLTNAVLLLFGGAMGDRYGRRRIFLLGVAIFGGGSLACALVHSTGPLIAARAVMGLGAAFLMPATLSIIASTFTGEQRARAIGIWAGVGGIGAAAGPLLGGWLLQHFWWGSVFLINVPIAVLAFIGGVTVVTESLAEHRPHFDPAGVLLSALGLTALTYGLIVAPTKHWGSSVVIGSFALSAVLLVSFILWDGRRDDPLLDLDLFRNRIFSSALGAVTAVFFAMFGVSYLLSQYIQFVQGANVFGVGLRFLPLAITSLISSNIAARLTFRFGLRSIMLIGMVLVTGGLAVFATVSVNSGFTPVAIAFGMIGMGIGLVIAARIQRHHRHAARRKNRVRVRAPQHGAAARWLVRRRHRREPSHQPLPVRDPPGLRRPAPGRSERGPPGHRQSDRRRRRRGSPPPGIGSRGHHRGQPRLRQRHPAERGRRCRRHGGGHGGGRRLRPRSGSR